MSTGTIIHLRANRLQQNQTAPCSLEEGDASALRARFEQVAAAALAHAEQLRVVECFPASDWEDSFETYTEQLGRVRELGDRLHPHSLRDRDEELTGDALVNEALELFAA